MNAHRDARPFERVLYPTRFDRFLHRENVDLVALAAAIGMTRQNLGRLRAGKQKPRQDTIATIVIELRRMLGRNIEASQLFYLGENTDDDAL